MIASSSSKRLFQGKSINMNEFDLNNAIDLTSYFEIGKGEAFGLAPPTKISLLPKEIGCQADRISFCAHASGTHTECILHVDLQAKGVETVLKQIPPFLYCLLLKITPETLESSKETYLGSIPTPEGHELVISRRLLEKSFLEVLSSSVDDSMILAMLIFTGESENWVFFTDQAMEFLKEKNIKHLLIDQVSVDRERCGPSMPAHRIFFHK